MRLFACLAGALLSASPAAAIDCPMRDRSFSIDSPFIDVLLSPAAREAVHGTAPGMIDGLPPFLSNTGNMSFASIMTPRTVAAFRHLSDDALAGVGAALRAVKVTAQDRVSRCARYDDAPVSLEIPAGTRHLFLFEKSNGFRDEPAVKAAREMFVAMAARRGWALVVTDKSGAMTPENLRRFDAVIWNNVSGDVLTVRQRRALRRFVERGGGFLGVHGSGGDLVYFWDWYRDILLGARFTGHTFTPQFQSARIAIEATPGRIGHSLAPGWSMEDEWYSFAASPRRRGATVVATLDEGSYSPIGRTGESLRMGDHPIAWSRCIGRGRSFYSAIGHRPASYADPRHIRLLEDAVAWVSGGEKARNDPCWHGSARHAVAPGRG